MSILFEFKNEILEKIEQYEMSYKKLIPTKAKEINDYRVILSTCTSATRMRQEIESKLRKSSGMSLKLIAWFDFNSLRRSICKVLSTPEYSVLRLLVAENQEVILENHALRRKVVALSDAVKTDKEDNVDQYNTITTKITGIESSVKAKNETIKLLRQENKQLTQQITDLESENNQLTDDVDILHENARKLQEMYTTKLEEGQILVNENTTLKEEIDIMQAKIIAYEKGVNINNSRANINGHRMNFNLV